MGTWGYDAFANDDASDWADELGDFSDLSLVEEALAAVEQVGDEYLDACTAWRALAACEVVARCLGKPGYMNVSTESVDAWVARHHPQPTPQLVGRANAAIERVLGTSSELRELWAEAGEKKDAQWRATVADLQTRIGFTGTP